MVEVLGGGLWLRWWLVVEVLGGGLWWLVVEVLGGGLWLRCWVVACGCVGCCG